MFNITDQNVVGLNVVAKYTLANVAYAGLPPPKHSAITREYGPARPKIGS